MTHGGAVRWWSIAVGSALALALVLVLALAVAGHAAAAEVVPGHYIVVLHDGERASSVAAKHRRERGVQPTAVFDRALDGYAAAIPGTEVAAVRADPAVAFVAAERRFHIDRVVRSPSCAALGNVVGPGQCLPAGAARVGADFASVRAGDGRGAVTGVNVAVVDTGIAAHPDLNVAGGVDCQSGTPSADPAGWDDRVIGHGTFVAGVVGAKDNGIGVVGTAPGVPLWAVDVSVGEDFTEASLLCGIDWITSTHADADPRNDIAVANVSLGVDMGAPPDGRCGRGDRDPIHAAVCTSVASGVAYVASAGNDATDFGTYIPASYDEVLTVTAMADFDGRPGGKASALCKGDDLGLAFGYRDDLVAEDFSSYAFDPRDAVHTVAAPGVCIDSTFPPDVYLNGDGTSFSAPYVAGTVAVCIATGACRGRTGTDVIRKVLAQAAIANLADRRFGYLGDPFRPLPANRFYGFLIREGMY